MNTEWKVHLSTVFDPASSFDGPLVHIYRVNPLNGTTEYLRSLDVNGDVVVTTIEEGSMLPAGDIGFRLPWDALRALAEVAKPGPTQAVVDELRNQLATEANRVDRILQRALRSIAPDS